MSDGYETDEVLATPAEKEIEQLLDQYDEWLTEDSIETIKENKEWLSVEHLQLIVR